MTFYTSVAQHHNKILVCGYENNKRFKKECHYKPYLFLPSKEKTGYRTIDGNPVEKLSFDSIRDARNFFEKYKDVENFSIYGLTNYPYVYIYDTFKNIQYDTSKIKTLILDIEVSTENGYPDIDRADSEITAITMMYDDITFVLGYKDFITSDINIKYFRCKDEYELLTRFIKLMSHDVYRPDVITGWNVEFFDIPYCINRIIRLFDESEAKKLSPWSLLRERTVQFMGREQQAFTPVGVSILDYLQLYMKFTYTQQESYKLDHIAFVELNEQKLDYSEYGSLNDLYKQNPQKYIEYNIHDCTLIKKLDDKMKLLDLVYTIAYDSGCNYEDALTTVRSWDVTIHNYLMDQRKVIPHVKKGSVDRIPAGGYVKQPQTGMFDWVVSFDLSSMYPHIIMGYNISPDTFVKQLPQTYTTEDLLNGKASELHSYLDENNISFTANSCVYSKKHHGFLAALMEDLFLKRKEYKTKLLTLEKEYEKNPSQELAYEIAEYNNLQMALKIRLNSAYGALANPYFRWFDFKYAESITLTGQFTIRWAEQKMNQFMNNILKTTDVDYCIASDTDSLYMNMQPLVKALNLENTNSDVVSILDKFCETKVQPYLNKIFDELADYMKAYKQAMFMKREGISDRGIFIAKKRYLLNVHNNEGIQYEKPKLKIMGLEAVRSSTPSACRDSIKDALKLILNGDESDVIAFIENFKADFKKMDFDKIAFPRGVNGIDKYKDHVTIYKKATPIHVRGALLFNHKLRELGLDKRYEQIYDKEKVKFCYLKLPNPIRENVISVANVLPKEFGLENYIDYDMQFEKAFLDPLKNVLDVIGWKTEKTNTLSGFFK